MARFLKFDMIVEAPAKLQMWWNDLNTEHKRELNKHMGLLPSLLKMPAYPELIEVLTGYWDSERMVFHFGTVEITPTIEELRDAIDTVGMGLKRRVKKEEGILIPNKPTVKEIMDYLNLRYADWVCESSVAFKDLYDRFGHTSSYINFNKEFKSYREWDQTRPLAFAIALLGIMVFPQGPSLTINTRIIMVAHTAFYGYSNQGVVKYYPLVPTIIADMYRVLGRCRNGHSYFQGCNLLLQWWIIKHLLKVEGTKDLHKLDNQDTILGMHNGMCWGDFEVRKTKKEWAQIFSELGEDNVQWMFNRFISKDVVVRGSKLSFLPLLGIRGIRPYAPIRVMRKFGRKQTIPPTGHMNIYVFDHGDDKVPNAANILKEWKKPLKLAYETIAEDRFNAGYVDEYKDWLKRDLQGLAFSVPNIHLSLEDKESRIKIELEQVKSEAREMQKTFLQKQEEDKYTIASLTQELESLRNDLGKMDTWMESRKGNIESLDWEKKGRRYEGYWPMTQYMLRHTIGQSKKSRT